MCKNRRRDSESARGDGMKKTTINKETRRKIADHIYKTLSMIDGLGGMLYNESQKPNTNEVKFLLAEIGMCDAAMSILENMLIGYNDTENPLITPRSNML
jgi:hypothetical protein